MKKSYIKVLLILSLLSLSVSFAYAIELKITTKRGELWTTAKGEVELINMTAVKDVWKEFAIKAKDGETILLIGDPTKNLNDKIGESITVSGVLKPRMRCKGDLVRVIEVREIK